MIKKRKVYISGKITGTTDYMERFEKAETRLKLMGFEVINPAKVNSALPESTTWEEYMEMSIVMLDMCDSIYMLDGWQTSRGANVELCHAHETKKTVMYEVYDRKAIMSSAYNYAYA